jgi:hypothetical protein
MTPEQALNILNQATEPGVKLTRNDYVLINQALKVLAEAIQKGNGDAQHSKESHP